MKEFDFIIIGGGIIGMTIADELLNNCEGAKILILEKEKEVSSHSSGRNSGVLHAGFYYTSDSLKAKFTKEGNKMMTQYCEDNNLKINKCGKVVVVKDEIELASLFELEIRGKKNKVDLKFVNEKELEEIEPNAKTFQKALYSPTTSSVDPVEISLFLKNSLLKRGVTISTNEGYHKRKKDGSITTTKGNKYKAQKIINTAGLYADKVAKDFGFSSEYSILPFKGIYLKEKAKSTNIIKTHIYPVPDLNQPFLGVHFTLTVNEEVKIGPTAIPAFWRENYNGFDNFSFVELKNILLKQSNLFFTNKFKFRDLAISEIRKYNKSHFTNLATKLIKDKSTIKLDSFQWSKPGIRAQLLNNRTGELVQDFVVESDSKSIHILNAVSPAFTCSFAFSKWVVKEHILI